MPWYKWSQTASANATADGTINWAEGQAPSSVNDSARAMMAATAQYRDDIAGAIVTTGTTTAYNVTSYSGFDTLAHLNGQMVAFSPHATNAQTVTLNVDSLGAKPLRSAPSVELSAGTLIQGTPYVAVYNNGDGVFYLRNFYGNPYNIPLAGGMDYWGFSTPNSSFVFPIGQAISRTTYAGLFSLMGTAYGPGDGSTTFNLPDKTGRVSAMIEASPTRLSIGFFGANSAGLGAVGGSDNHTLVTANLPPYTPAGTVAPPTVNALGNAQAISAANGSVAFLANTAGSANTYPSAQMGLVTSGAFTGSAQGGTSSAFAIVQPTICCNYILRVI